MAHAFISHTSNDQHFVNLLAAILTYHRVPIWYSETDIPAGTIFPEEISTALKDADTLIAVASLDAQNSTGMKDEMETFRTLKPKGDIIPLILTSKVDLDKVYQGLSNTQYIDFTLCMAEGFEKLLAYYGQEFLRNINDRTGEPDRRETGERRVNIVERFRRDCWNAYQTASKKRKFDILDLDMKDIMTSINALDKSLQQHKFYVKEHRPLHCKSDILDDVVYSVAAEMRNNNMYKAIHFIDAIAEEICRRFNVELYDRRTARMERRSNIDDPRTPVTTTRRNEKRSNIRKICDTSIHIARNTGENIKVKVLNQSQEGIGFFCPEKIDSQEIIHAHKLESTNLPFQLSKKFSIMRDEAKEDGYFYGAKALAA